MNARDDRGVDAPPDGPAEPTELAVRATTEGDVDGIVAVAAAALGWETDERSRAFFCWKHLENPHGASPGWVAVRAEGPVAFRTMLRWRFLRPSGGGLDAVRAVDTATDPAFQGRGLFRRLTTHAVDELTAEGVHAVFNTPNDQSRPGYLRMGWQVLGRPTLLVQPSAPSSLVRMLRARVPAEKWSEPVDVGAPMTPTLAAELRAPASSRISTDRTPAHLAWRYGFEPLHYRVAEVDGGHAVLRVRRRGPLRELAVVEWLSERPDPGAVRRLVRACGADYAVAIGLTARHGFVPVPRQGPIVTWRPLAEPDVPALADVAFSLGDLELL